MPRYEAHLVGRGEALDEHRELVAAEARQHVARSQLGMEPDRDRPQELVADEVAEAVVHELEAVEVDEEHGVSRAARADGAGDRVLQQLAEQPPVGQAGEVVVACGARVALLRLTGGVERLHGLTMQPHHLPMVTAVGGRLVAREDTSGRSGDQRHGERQHPDAGHREERGNLRRSRRLRPQPQPSRGAAGASSDGASFGRLRRADHSGWSSNQRAALCDYGSVSIGRNLCAFPYSVARCGGRRQTFRRTRCLD